MMPSITTRHTSAASSSIRIACLRWDCIEGLPSIKPQPIEEHKVRYFITGCAGFIGSALTDRLLGAGHSVVGYDNFSTGRETFVSSAREHPAFRLVHADILEASRLGAEMRGSDLVFHLAANADV